MTDFAITTLMRNAALNADGEEVGKVTDVLLSPDGTITAVVLQLGGVLGVGARLVSVPFELCQLAESETGRFVRLPNLKTGEVMVASQYEPIDGTALERFTEKAGALSQAAVSSAVEAGQSLSHAAAEFAGDIKRRAEPGQAAGELVEENPANDVTTRER